MPADSRRSATLAASAPWCIRDNDQLNKINQDIKVNLKQSKFRQALDTAVAVAASFVAAQAGGTAPSHYPIFSSALAGDLQTPDEIYIEQDKVSSDTLSEFLCNFLSVAGNKRPEVFISYYDRSQLLSLLSKVSAMINVRQLFGKEIRQIHLEPSTSESNEVVAFVLSGNHLPNLNRYLGGDHSILLGWAAAKSAKLHDVPGEAEEILLNTLQLVQLKINEATTATKTFWMTLYIQLLLDMEFFKDGRTGGANQALLLARQLDDNALIAHCERFANQSLGVGDEALAMLNDSNRRFSQIPENSEEYLIYTPSRLAALLNRNTTMLISATKRVDPSEFEADYRKRCLNRVY